MKNLLIITLLVFSVACNNADQPKENETPKAAENAAASPSPAQEMAPSADTMSQKKMESPASNSKLTVKTYKNEDSGWGYDILANDKPYIHQPHIPAVPGIRGFSTEEKAMKAAEFVISKIKKGAGMPTISVKEMDSLGVTK